MTQPTTPSPPLRVAGFACAALIVTALAMLFSAVRGEARDLQSQLSQKRSQLQAERSRQARLSTTLSDYSAQIGELSSQVATLRDREAKVQQQLAVKEAELQRAKAKLVKLRKRLHASLRVLRERLVAMYESAPPNALNVILSAHGFNQLSTRYEYLSTIEHQDTSIVATVRRLRNEAQDTVDRIQAARDQLAAQRQELARTRNTLQARVSGLAAARSRKASILSQVRSNSQNLQGDINDLQGRIAAAAQAAQEQQSASSSLGGAPSVPLASSTGAGACRPGDLPVPCLCADRLGPDRSGSRWHHDARHAAAGDGFRDGDDRARSGRLRHLLSDPQYLIRRLLLRPLRAYRGRWSQRLDRTADRYRSHRDVGKLDHSRRL